MFLPIVVEEFDRAVLVTEGKAVPHFDPKLVAGSIHLSLEFIVPAIGGLRHFPPLRGQCQPHRGALIGVAVPPSTPTTGDHIEVVARQLQGAVTPHSQSNIALLSCLQSRQFKH